MKTLTQPTFLVVDLFCGFGGTTLGFERSGVAKVVACVNHDPNAIRSHWLNHPEVVHFEEDIRTLQLSPLLEVVQAARRQHPQARLILWASLECTNFSKAKGGLPREADSRTLANDLPRYITALKPDYIMIENVLEFMSWGPLDEKGKPISRRNGQDWLRWRESIRNLGYEDAWRELDSADFGAYTSRVRLFGVFARHNMPIAWPLPTHARNPEKGMFGGLKKWKPVREVLDLHDEGTSIFERKTPLVEKTLERILAGLEKFWPQDAFMQQYFSGRPEGKVYSLTNPCRTIMTVDHNALVFLTKWNSTSPNGKVSAGASVQGVCPTVTVQQRIGLVRAVPYLLEYYGNGRTLRTAQPCGTLTTHDRFGMLTVKKSKLKNHAAACETDSPALAKIRAFMRAHGIADIKLRMLRVPELLRIQGFPSTYKMTGTQAEHKKFIGNSVVPQVVEAWAKTLSTRIVGRREVMV